jgi:hypothetical protein
MHQASGLAARFPINGNFASTQRLDPAEPGDRLYRFEALEIKELSQRLGGGATKSQQLLALLVRPEAEIQDSLQEMCTMFGLTVEAFTQSIAYRCLRQPNRRCGPLS